MAATNPINSFATTGTTSQANVAPVVDRKAALLSLVREKGDNPGFYAAYSQQNKVSPKEWADVLGTDIGTINKYMGDSGYSIQTPTGGDSVYNAVSKPAQDAMDKFSPAPNPNPTYKAIDALTGGPGMATRGQLEAAAPEVRKSAISDVAAKTANNPTEQKRLQNIYGVSDIELGAATGKPAAGSISPGPGASGLPASSTLATTPATPVAPASYTMPNSFKPTTAAGTYAGAQAQPIAPVTPPPPAAVAAATQAMTPIGLEATPEERAADVAQRDTLLRGIVESYGKDVRPPGPHFLPNLKTPSDLIQGLQLYGFTIDDIVRATNFPRDRVENFIRSAGYDPATLRITVAGGAASRAPAAAATPPASSGMATAAQFAAADPVTRMEQTIAVMEKNANNPAELKRLQQVYGVSDASMASAQTIMASKQRLAAAAPAARIQTIAATLKNPKYNDQAAVKTLQRIYGISDQEIAAARAPAAAATPAAGATTAPPTQAQLATVKTQFSALQPAQRQQTIAATVQTYGNDPAAMARIKQYYGISDAEIAAASAPGIKQVTAGGP